MKRRDKYVANVLQQLEAFLNDTISNKWVENTAIQVYVRKSQHSLSRHSSIRFTCLDIAKIAFPNAIEGKECLRTSWQVHMKCIRLI